MDVPPVTHARSDAASSANVARACVVTNVLESILFREVLAPLTAALGPVGNALSDRVVDGVLGRRNA